MLRELNLWRYSNPHNSFERYLLKLDLPKTEVVDLKINSIGTVRNSVKSVCFCHI